VSRRDIHYLRTTVEGYDGMAVVRTVDPAGAVIELQIAPGCEQLVSSLIASLRDREGIALEPVAQSTEIRRESRERKE
jgi:hypothetical protein